MLSAIGRSAARRAGIGAFTACGRVGELSWRLLRVVIAQNQSTTAHAYSLCEVQDSQFSRRCFATATKAQAKPRAKKDVSTKEPRATKRAPAGSAKKPKKPKKKVAAKRKPAVKKALTEEQESWLAKKRARVVANRAKLQVKELKKAALLSEPKELPSSAWLVVMLEEFKKQQGDNYAGFKAVGPAASAKYKSLTTSEREHYNHIANQNKATNEAAYKDWVAQYQPEQIRLANLARLTLKRKASGKQSKHITSIKDPRAPRKPAQARIHFIKERWASGDFRGLTFKDSLKTLHEDFKALPAQEKKRFEAESIADKERYDKEYKNVYNHDPRISKTTKVSA